MFVSNTIPPITNSFKMKCTYEKNKLIVELNEMYNQRNLLHQIIFILLIIDIRHLVHVKNEIQFTNIFKTFVQRFNKHLNEIKYS